MSVRTLVAALVGIAGVVAVSVVRMPANETLPSAVPVLVELFTSEGCSSCPPADDVLTRLASTQPVPGATIIALSEHVDYWDRLGWRDRFSSAALTKRQSDYSRTLVNTDIYTPQMVVNGRKAFVGSDYRAATAAVAAAARETAGRVRVSISRLKDEGSDLNLWVRVEPVAGASFAADLDVLLAVTEDGLVTDVRRGENRGHTLRHSAVVRVLEPIGVVRRGAATWSTTRALPFDADWKRANLSMVAFARDHGNHRVAGVDSMRH